MIYQVVTVRDRAAAGYGRPIFVAAIGQAIRSFQDEINRVAPDNEMNRHPGDYDLYHLGTFNDEDAKFNTLEQPKQIAIGHQLRTNHDAQK